MMPALSATQIQYLSFSDALKALPGHAFENHGHPAVVLDRVGGLSTRVWGWWTPGSPALPCLLWSGELGWSATVVEPNAFDTMGYERVFWSHRIKLLDLALASALGPYASLEELEMHVAAQGSFGPDARGLTVKRAMLWGILHLRSARTPSQSSQREERRLRPVDRVPAGLVDEELIRHALVPMLAKPPPLGDGRRHKDPAVDTLVQALCDVRLDRQGVEDDR